MQKCESCGKDFYSDVEFAEHQTRHWLEGIAKENGRMLANIDWRLGFLAVLLIKGQEGGNFEEALKKYSEYHGHFNSYTMARAKDGMV